MTNKVKGYLFLAAAVFLLFVLLALLSNVKFAFFAVAGSVTIVGAMVLAVKGLTLIDDSKYDSR